MSRLGRQLAGAAAVIGAVAGATALVGVAGATNGDGLEQVRDTTRRFREVDRAIDDGYVQFFGCVHEPLQGAMGTHFVNGALVGDPTIDAATPEALMYEIDERGRYRLLGVEYVVFKDAWDASNAAPPELFGKTFNVVEAPNRYGIPAFYELHAWAWKSNPAGAHLDWNPRVLCEATEGHVH